MNRYAGKRFAGLVLCIGALLAAFFGGQTDSFNSFSTALGLLYGAYLTGQTATDHKAIANGQTQ